MPRIIKTVLEDTTVYFFVMAMCHLCLILSVLLAKVVAPRISEDVCVAHTPPTAHPQTLACNVSSFDSPRR